MKKLIAILLGVLLFAFPLAACADTPTGKPDDGGAAYVDPDLPDGTTENPDMERRRRGGSGNRVRP